MTGEDRCFRCHKSLGENPMGILLMYPGRDGTTPLYTLPRMYCNDCIASFYQWTAPQETKMQRALRLSRENSEYGSFEGMKE